jgi:hypothetical protein
MSFELTHARGGKSARSWRSGRNVMMKFRSNKRDTIACPDADSSIYIDGVEVTENDLD